ncbi:MAG: HAD family phosphatase [Candidatus Micrarchaeaceae archaeon]
MHSNNPEPKSNQIKLIIFDLGGVIIDFTEDKYFSYLSKESGIPASKISNIFGELIEKMESDRMRLSEMEEIVKKRLGINKNKIRWSSVFYELSHVNQDVKSMMLKLKKNYRIAILSNISRSRFLESLKLIKGVPYERYFASVFLHLRKPDPRIYLYALRKMHVLPAESIFIDNRVENVRGAEAVGMHGILFKSAADLENKLAKLGVKLQ